MSDSQDALLVKKRARRRLIGAVALVLLVVIVLPMVLDKDPKPLQNELSVQIPRQDAGGFKTRVLPAATAPAKGETPSDASKSATPAAATTAALPPAAKEASKTAEKPASKEAGAADQFKQPEVKAPVTVVPAAEAERAQAALRDESWVIPMGTFASAVNVKQLQAKLGAAGVKSSTETVKSATGDQIRVRGGPFKTKAEAETARQALVAAGMDAGAVTTR
ncbi:MAG: SPOR domain-containing protein [Proteobacteria bacterium]|nr:SPOR domain-containing protein [Pseudomonadota bacterium]